MASYVKSTDFASKDALLSGDPAKIIKGTEIDTEFNAIAVAISTKADLVSPTFTGTPTAPTAAPGTNSTQIATTAFVTAALQTLYPVGSVYINATSSTNPATLLGFGTWTAFGAGRVMVGLDSSDALFDTEEETGGSKDAIVVQHNHTATDSGHAHTYRDRYYVEAANSVTGATNKETVPSGTYNANYGANGTDTDNDTWLYYDSTTGSGTSTISVANSGSSGTNANIQPYIVVRMWKRTA
jgi:hypothetical protein